MAARELPNLFVRVRILVAAPTIRKDYNMKEFYVVADSKIEIGDIVVDKRKNALVTIETEKDIISYSCVAPELYVIFR